MRIHPPRLVIGRSVDPDPPDPNPAIPNTQIDRSDSSLARSQSDPVYRFPSIDADPLIPIDRVQSSIHRSPASAASNHPKRAMPACAPPSTR
jgi:hypothetical protein